MDFPGDSVVKNLPASSGDARDAGFIPGLGRSPEDPLKKEMATPSSMCPVCVLILSVSFTTIHTISIALHAVPSILVVITAIVNCEW